MKARIILQDPPWKYNSRRATRKDNPTKKCVFGMGADRTYEERDGMGCMSIDDLCNIGHLVDKATTDDAYMFLWATCPLLPEALRYMEACNFRYVTVAHIWVKLNAKQPTVFRGVGNYTQSNMEPVLMGVKGHMWHPKKGYKPGQVILAPHPKDERGKKIHSRKPDQLHEEIEKWLWPHVGGHDSLEMFATKERQGWTTLGYALSKKDIIEELKDYLNR
jgi:N6-adenosine-specific RNA methylase IME4